MPNIALGKPIEEPVKNAAVATDGEVTGYTDHGGFAYFRWPGSMTVDLGETQTLCCIRILLWDGLGQGSGQRDSRIYKYRLLTSVDHHTWNIIFDSADDGFNGWQVFSFPQGIDAHYVRVHGLWNSSDRDFHVVQVEAYDSEPPPLAAETVLHRTVSLEITEQEIGDGLPFTSRVVGIINGIENLVESNEFLKPEPFRDLITQLRVQVSDISALEKSMDSIRREIIGPVSEELERGRKLGKYSVWGFVVGIVGGILAIISLVLDLFPRITGSLIEYFSR